jgi:uncharacterized protein YcbX
MATVSWLSVAPVKGLALVRVDRLRLERFGALVDRRFHLIDAAGERLGLMRHGPLVQIRAEYDPDAERLALHFPDGSTADGNVELGDAVTTDFYGRPVEGRIVDGPWAAPLSAYAGRPVRLVQTLEPGAGVDRHRGGVSMLSEASLEELARRSGRESVDERRFRMMIGLAGTAPHEEDEWLGRHVRVGEALVSLRGPVGRCAITTQDPSTGVRDFDTLREIKNYRGVRDREIDFGVYGEVVEAGEVRVGDDVAPLELGLFDSATG